MVKSKGWFLEFSLGGRTQFSSVVEPDGEEMFRAVWASAGKRIFEKIAQEDRDGNPTPYGEFRIRPILD